MAGKNYIGYSVEDLLQDQEFISVVKEINTIEEWEQFLQSQGGSKKNILQARKIIQLFKTNEGVLSDNRKYKIWRNISKFNVEFSRNYNHVRLKTFAKVAASVLILISLGSLLYLSSYNKVDNQFQFSESQNELKPENPVLVLSDGSKVELEKSDPHIVVLKGQDAIQIDNDSIVENHTSIDEKTNEIKFNEIIIPYGKKSKLVLEDGTIVWLNAGSRFAFPQRFRGRERAVHLEGEAYFEVAKNENQPFVVVTDNINIEVLGTKFNVLAYNSNHFSETVLLEGSVNIWEKGKLFDDKIMMTPGQKATYNNDNKNIEVVFDPAPEMRISWVEGWCQFSNENLEYVLQKLERYYNINFQYNQEIISKLLPVSGKLDLKDSLSEVMVVLSGVAKFEYQISENNVIIIK